VRVATAVGWRLWYRRCLGWVPVQFCMVCGRAYWGGLPTATWRACWMDYCSRACADWELGLIRKRRG
jgi:hypothetical protein